jgi:hypothetical protein
MDFLPLDCEFVILGCAPSNLGGVSYPFVVVVSKVSKGRRCLEAYVLNGWANIRKFFTDEVREDVIFFIEDLRRRSASVDPESFVRFLRTLSVGPIRFVDGGTCAVDLIDFSISNIFESRLEPILWPDSFSPI